ncbi:CobW family GTP-binding protein [Falsiroseomonas oryzae]|uniref:CobW family GTP-binding protein n=1 Tax=Falsiroseomonas oryzae TaxID=2766473 RepID=UPI0022EA7E99|nr:GTP-binding protein [Roseomonas sp. MO-31]
MEKLPLVLLTGFLGAGKTTCLNAALAARDATGVVVLVNEFGAVDVDGMLLPAANRAGALVELTNGCICCTIQGDLLAALEALLRFRAEAPGRARLAVLETTGLADPGAILATLARAASLRGGVAVARVVTVCDAPGLADQRARFPVAERQIGAADAILLTRTETMPAAALAALRDELAGANPLAEIRAVSPESLDPRLLLGPWPAASAHRPPAPSPAFAAARVPAPRRAEPVAESFVVRPAAPLDADRLRDALSFLALRHAERLLRCKGVIRIAGEPHPVLLQGMRDVMRTSRAPDGAALAEGDCGALVFIGLGLPEAAIRADLARCEAPG